MSSPLPAESPALAATGAARLRQQLARLLFWAWLLYALAGLVGMNWQALRQWGGSFCSSGWSERR